MSFARLGKNSEFQKVYRRGKAKANRYLVMIVEKGQSGPSRYGFSVSKKVGNSVERHRVTRYLRESIRKYDAQVTGGNRVIVIAKPLVREMGLNEISKAVESLLKAHHILSFRA